MATNSEFVTKKISELIENVEPSDTDTVVVGNSGTDEMRRITWANMTKKFTISQQDIDELT